MMNPNNPLTPGVYIQELSAFPNSIVEVETAVPVFIGYTQKADYNGENLLMKPVQLASMNDYINFFGGASNYKLDIAVTTDPNPDFSLTVNGTLNHYAFSYQANTNYYLYNCMQLFYQNGGGKCYIVSAGAYPVANGPIVSDLITALNKTANVDDITLICIPDSLLLDVDNYNNVNTTMLAACSNTQSRFALFDIYGGDKFKNAADLQTNPDNLIANFRTAIGENFLNYGAAYFPWLQTSISDKTDITLSNFDVTFISSLIEIDKYGVNQGVLTKLVTPIAAAAKTYAGDFTDDTGKAIAKAHNSLLAISNNYSSVVKAAIKFINILPVAPAMAGIYTMVDSNRGVWKAPANVSVNAVINPMYNFTDDEQGSGCNLNVDPDTGKSINIIRSFPGIGTMVWGARTLDGNSQDWKYINVRRTMIMIEQSVKQAARAYVFEPNVANTWITIQCMLGNFLNDLWKQGALAGATPTDAFSVSVGLGTTMTADDILLGIMRITVLVAISHPAEFLIFTFEQQMQKS